MEWQRPLKLRSKTRKVWILLDQPLFVLKPVALKMTCASFVHMVQKLEISVNWSNKSCLKIFKARLQLQKTNLRTWAL